jgi:pimeloyl-ACP methyl ester carboxylesterase
MATMPFGLLFLWLLGLLSLAMLGGGLYLLWAWYVGVVVGTGYLVASLAMLVLTFTGRWLVLLFHPSGPDEPTAARTGAAARIGRPDGTELQVEHYGPADSPVLLFTHGNGTNSTAWYYAKRQLADRFRLILWDLPGLGKSEGPRDNDYHLEKMAGDLEAVLQSAGDRPVVLVGHSIGGMIVQTFCRLFPHHLGTRVAGLVLLDTTYTNPVKTTTGRGFFRAVQKPLVEPLLYLMIWLSPLVWLMNWLSYFNGSAHLASILTGFAGSETRGQLDFATRFTPLASPAVQARNTLGMLQFDATAYLAAINVPVLVLVGHLDRVTIPEASTYISEQVPLGQLAKLAPGGHMALLEQHERVPHLIGEFAAKCIRSPDDGKPAVNSVAT